MLAEKKLGEREGEKINLNERQMKALDFIKNQKEITRKDYMKINKVSNKTAYIETNSLVKKDIVKIVGKGRVTKYVFG